MLRIPFGRSLTAEEWTNATEASRVAVTLIARDEEDRLPGALASVRWADEVIVVVDAACRDRTEEIARAAGARVLVRPFDGFGPQKNAAASLATAPWILSIDADEIVSPELALEVRAQLLDMGLRRGGGPSPIAFRVPIRLEFLGRTLRFGRETVVRPIRLYHRNRARFTDDLVHERVVADGLVDTLDESILHRSYRNLSHYLAKLDRYTTLAAEAKWVAGRSAVPLLPVRVLWELFDRTFLRLSILDGAPGLTYATLSAGNTFLKYLKLSEIARTASIRSEPELRAAPLAERQPAGAP